MILYLDSSALIKRYVEEERTGDIDTLWDDVQIIVSSTVSFAECIAAFRRKFREGFLSEKEYGQTVKAFKNEYARLILVPITSELNHMIEDLLLRHGLRGFDTIHLASALLIKKESHLSVSFACFDQALNKAADKEGLNPLFYKKGNELSK